MLSKFDNSIFWHPHASPTPLDGPTDMLGSKWGFQMLVHKKTIDVVTTHCFVHRESSVSKIGNRESLRCVNKEVSDIWKINK